MPKASPPFPSLSPNGGGGGGGGGAGESGRRPPDLQGEVSPLSWSIPGEMSNPGGLFPDLRKSKNEATNPAFDSESFSSPYKDRKNRTKRKSDTHTKHHNHSQANQTVEFSCLFHSHVQSPLEFSPCHQDPPHQHLHSSFGFSACSCLDFWCCQCCRAVQDSDPGRGQSPQNHLTKQGLCQIKSPSSARHQRRTEYRWVI